MKNTLLKSLLLALVFTFAVNAELYKGLDDEGNVVYSDMPFDNAQQFTPPPLSVVDAPRVKQEKATKTGKASEEETDEFKYTDFDIVSPTNNQTIWNNPNLTVSLRLKPALNTAQGHNIWLLVDGRPLVKNSQSLSLQIGRVNRGAHQLQAQLRDQEGKIVIRSRTIVMHINNTVVRP